MTTSPEARLKELNLTLPTPGRPMARYKMAVRAGNMLYVSGHGPVKITPQTPVTGRCGGDLTTEQGKESARGRNEHPGHGPRPARLARPRQAPGQDAGDGQQHARLRPAPGGHQRVFRTDGRRLRRGQRRRRRSAVGIGALPGNIAVEIECIFEVE